MEKLIEEGGSAVGGRPIKQEEVPEIIEKVNELLISLGLEQHEDFDAVGSAGKKKVEDESGDIDFIVNRKKVAEVLGVAGSTPIEIVTALKNKMEELGFYAIQNNGLKVVSFAMPFKSDDDLIQIDLIIAGSMEFSRFFQTSPDYRNDESKYKSNIRNIFLMTISSTVARRTTLEVKLDNGYIGPAEVERYAVRLNDGLFKVRKNWIGKRNKLIKTEETVSDELVYETPQDFINFLFNNTKPEDLISFESTFEVFMSDKFKFPEHREKILVSAAMAYIKETDEERGIFVPSEISDEYITKAKEKIRQSEERYLANKNSQIVERIPKYENMHIKSFETFINEQKESSITVTFKEVYMKKEVTRTCMNMSKEGVIAVYGLNEPDIEWYQFEGEEKVFNTK